MNSNIFEAHRVVKQDNLFELRMLGAGIVIIGIIGAIVIAILRQDIIPVLEILWLIPLGAVLFWYVSPWAPSEKRRQSAALQEDTSVPLAAEQPVPDETALTLPYTIKLRPKWKIPLICFAVLTPLSCGALLLLIYATYPAPVDPSWIPFSIVLSIIWSAAIASMPLLLGWRGVKVTERGVTVHEANFLNWGANTSIKWCEIRLFAIYPSRKLTDSRLYYELAGRTAIVRWRRMRPDDPFRFAKPPASFEDYDRQMDALLSLIAAKSGMPLYDLR